MKQSAQDLSLAAWIKDGLKILKNHPGALIGALLMLCTLEGAVDALAVLPYGDVASIVIAFLITPLYVGWMLFCLKGLRGEPMRIGDIFGVYARFGPLMASFFLYLLLFIGGSAFFAVPGFYLAVKFMFAALALMDRDFNVAGAFRYSDEITKGHKWRLLALFLLCVVPGLTLMVLGMLHEHRVLETAWHAPYNFAFGFAFGLLLILPMGLFYASSYESLAKNRDNASETSPHSALA